MGRHVLVFGANGCDLEYWEDDEREAITVADIRKKAQQLADEVGCNLWEIDMSFSSWSQKDELST